MWEQCIACAASRFGRVARLSMVRSLQGRSHRRGARSSAQPGAAIPENVLKSVGWGTWIRTRTNGVRVRWSTVNLFPKVAVGRCPSRRCGGLINKSAANANTFWQKNAISMWRRDFCTDLPVPTVRRGAAHLRPGGGAGHDCEGVQIAIAVRSVDRIRPYPLAAQSKTVWRTGLALVQSRQRKIERAP